MPHSNTNSLFALLLLVLAVNAQLCPLPNTSNNDLLQAGTALISNTYANIAAKR